MIKYKQYGNTITESQAENLDYFDKEYYVANELKKVETYKNTILFAVRYIMDSSEIEATVVNSFNSLNVYSITIEYLTIIGSYIQEISKVFDENGVLRFETKTLLAQDDNEICSISLFDIFGEIPPNTISKGFNFFIGGNPDVEAGFRCEYNSDGSFKSASLVCPEDKIFNEEWIGNFDSIPVFDMSPIDWEYFRTDVFDPTGYELP